MRNLSVRLVYGRRSAGIAGNSRIGAVYCAYTKLEIRKTNYENTNKQNN